MSNPTVSFWRRAAASLGLADPGRRQDREADAAAQPDSGPEAAPSSDLAREIGLLRTVIDHLPEYIYVKDRDSRFLLASRSHAADLGLDSPERMIGKTDFEFFDPKFAQSYFEDEQEVMRTGRPLLNRDEPVETPRGTKKWVLTTKAPLHDGNGEVIGIVGVSSDITERKNSNERFRALVEAAPDALLIVNASGIIELCNGQAERLFGFTREELEGLAVEALVPSAQRTDHVHRRAEYFAAPKTRPMHSGLQLRAKRKDGSQFPAEISLAPFQAGNEILVVASVRDVTERNRIEERLRESQKLEAIGTLAGGVAHDFNNLLTGIIGFIELAAEDLPSDGRQRTDLDNALLACRRGKDLTAQILAFSRSAAKERHAIRIAEIASEALRLLRATIPARIELKSVILEASGCVRMDPTQLHQVIVNLCTNSYQAMPSEAGRIYVEVRPVDLRDGLPTALKPGPYVLLSVEDDGAGMAPETRRRAFEPFFTTKPPGRGSGLALSVVHGIVRECGGTVELKSEVGRGTRIAIYLPRVRAAEGSPTHRTPAEETNSAPAPLRRRILFVDDEQLIAEFGRRMLTSQGYEVEAYTNSLVAWKAFEAAPDRFDLVITDLSMPGLGGRELAGRCLAMRADIPIVVGTGFSELLEPEEALAMGISRYVRKPYNSADLARAVKGVLAGKTLSSEYA